MVAGGSRGAGRGIARALGEAGATVYVAARSSLHSPSRHCIPGTVEETAEEVTARGGKGIPVRVDLSVEEEAAELFECVERDQGRLDLLANSAWAVNIVPEWSKSFWELSQPHWPNTMGAVSACWFTSVYAMRTMIRTKNGFGGGLILHVTDNDHENPSADRGQILHDVGHECLNRLIPAMSKQASRHKIAVVGLNPGFMRTEAVLMQMKTDTLKRLFRFDLSESPEYIGRAVTNLAADSNVLRKTGQLLWVADLAAEYGFTDIDGRRIPIFDPKAPEQAMPA